MRIQRYTREKQKQGKVYNLDKKTQRTGKTQGQNKPLLCEYLYTVMYINTIQVISITK